MSERDDGGDQFAKALMDAMEEGRKRTEKLPKPIADVWLSKAGMAIDVCLDTSKSAYSEWIEGEGADISLQRDEETKKVVGARLPLYAKTLIVGGEFGVITIDLDTGSVEVEKPEKWTKR